METIVPLDTAYLHITKACNLRCAYCYFSAGEPMEEELSTQEILSVLGDVHRLNPRRVVFTGGEPLLRKDTSKLAQALKNMDNGIHLCITTNGTLVNEEAAKDLTTNFDEIRISIDCFQEVNDATRGEGTFQKAMNAFRHVLNAGGDPVAFITVTSVNLPHLKQFMQFLLGNGITKIHLSPLKLAGRAKDDKMSCDLHEVKRIVGEFWYENFGLQLRDEKKEEFNCGVGKFVTVYPDGSVYPCHLLAFPEFCIGNVREQDLYSIYHQSTLMNKLRNLHLAENALCKEHFKETWQETACLGAPAQERKFREQLLNLLTTEAEQQSTDR